MKNQIPILFAFIGGILLVQTTWVGSVGFLADIATYATTYFPASAEIVTFILNVLVYIEGLGGIAVIIGGILFLMSRIGTGKFIIGLGAGIGLIGLIIMLVEAVLAGGVEALLDVVTLISQSIAWIGVILSIIARRTVSTE